MKYFLIAGEASGDLHASNLMAALKKQDAEADFRFMGRRSYAGSRRDAGEALQGYGFHGLYPRTAQSPYDPEQHESLLRRKSGSTGPMW